MEEPKISVEGENSVAASPNSSTDNNEDKGKPAAKRKAKQNRKRKSSKPVEILLSTFVIQDYSKLQDLIKMLKDVDICGISLEGQNIGRDGIVSWIIVVAEKTIIPIKVAALSKETTDVWKNLKKHLFCNPSLVKIMHDSRPAADYLFHVHGIKMVNIFDTQVADATCKEFTPSHLKSLPECLKYYCKGVNAEEIKFLEKYEKQDFSKNSPMLETPLPPPEYLKLCAVKVKHLILLREKLMVNLMRKLSACTEAHMNSFRKQTMEAYESMHKETTRPSKELLSKLTENKIGAPRGAVKKVANK